MILKIILSIYFIINVFLTGMWYEADLSGRNWNRYKLPWLTIPFVFLVQLSFSLLAIIIDWILEGGDWLFTYFQVAFFWQYLFTKKYHNMHPDALADYQARWGRILIKPKTLRGKILQYCLKLVFKRNNYTPA